MKSYKEDSGITRIAILETIAYETKETLKVLKEDMKSLNISLKEDMRSLSTCLKEDMRSLDTKMDNISMKVDEKIEKMNARLWINFYWTIGGFASVLLLLAKLLKWIP